MTVSDRWSGVQSAAGATPGEPIPVQELAGRCSATFQSPERHNGD